MDTDFQVFLGIFAVLLLLWIFLETHYFLQMLFTLFASRFIKRRVGVFQETSYHGVCSTTDVDVFFDHMNNCRYLREIEFARCDFYMRTRLWSGVVAAGGRVLVGANLVLYRRPIRPLARYTITSKIVYWDKKAVYMEHRIVTVSDAVLRAIVLSQHRFVDCDTEQVLRGLGREEAPVERLPMPAEVARLVDTIKESWVIGEYENPVATSPHPHPPPPTTKEDLNANGEARSTSDHPAQQ